MNSSNYFYIDNQTIINAFNSLNGTDIKNASLLHIFFILKGSGFNSIDYKSVDDISEKGFEPSFLISSLFSSNEEKTDKYDFINPFNMGGWNNQSPSEPLKKWVNSRIKNNVIGGATTWRKLININSRTNEIKFSYDYLEQLRELTFSENEKIDLYAFSIWAMKFLPFEEKITLRELVAKTIKIFNLEEQEIEQLFHKKKNIHIIYSDKVFQTYNIRKMIGNPIGLSDWVDEKKELKKIELNLTKSREVISMKDLNQINPDYIYDLLNSNHQVILSGPPGTSKSFYCEQLESKYTKVKKIQFHPDYSYQQFVGGYIVVGDKVEYKDGVLLEILNNEIPSINENDNYLLIIEEINRANVSQVFGETVQCLDRNYEVSLTTDSGLKKISLPKNLHIIGTMNSSDRTIGSIDLAVKRRFIQVYCKSNPNLLIDLCVSKDDLSITDFLVAINKSLYKVLKNREYQIGHAFFLDNSFKKGDKYDIGYKALEKIFNFSILPFIEDFCYGDDAQLHDIVGTDLPNRLNGELFSAAIDDFLNN